MSYEDGWAAVHLEKPPRIPRTEFDAECHWGLVRAVTGIEVDHTSDGETRRRASRAFREAWNYDILLSCLGLSADFGEWHTNMGHAEYAAGGVDYDDRLTCPFAEPEQVLAFDPAEALGPRDPAGLVGRVQGHDARQSRDNPHTVNMTGIYVTCFSGLIHLFGWEMLLTAGGLDPDRFGEVTRRYAAWIQQYYNALAECDAPVVYCHDDIVWTTGAVFRPDWYRRFIFPSYRRLFAPLIDAGKKVIFISDGNYDEFVDDVAACGVAGFFFEPLTSLEVLAAKYGRTHILIGNVDTRVLLSGGKAEIRAEVQRCVAIGRDCPGYFLAVSNMIPPNTPVEAALYYNEVYTELSRR